MRSYVESAGGEGWSGRENHEAFGRWVLLPRVLAGVNRVRLESRLLDDDVRAPIFVAPMAYQGLLHPDGERGTARAAAAAGVLMTLSTLSTDSLEAVAATRPAGPRWFQLYLQPSWRRTEALVRRAERAGYSAIVLTADVPVLGMRDAQLRTGFAVDATVPVGNGPSVAPPPRQPEWSGTKFERDSSIVESWEVVDRLRRASRLPIVVKGILSARDAREAVRHGARAVVVSNHGGRQLDRVPAPLDVLPEVVGAVGRKVEVYLDGGVRRGSDALIALALGARAVGVGRPVLWALAADGTRGVQRYLELLTSELATALFLIGRSRISDIHRSLVRRSGARGSADP